MYRCALLFCLFVTLITTASCTLLGSGNGQGLRKVHSTTFKFIGEQSFSLNVTGQSFVELDLSGKDSILWCQDFYHKKLLADYEGRIVVISELRQCSSFDILYSKLSEMNVVAVIIGTSLIFPGRRVFAHDDSHGHYTRYHSMPFLEISLQDIRKIKDALRAGDIVILEPTPNAWLAAYQSSLWICMLRVLPTLIALITALTAANHFFRHDGNHRPSWTLSKMLNGDLTLPEVVLMIETASMIALSVVFGLGNQAVGETMTSNKAVIFFYPSLTGVGLFTSAMLLLILHANRERSNFDNADIHKPLRDYGKKKVACIAVSSLSFECIVYPIMASNNGNHVYMLALTKFFIVAFIYGVVQLGIAVSFVFFYIEWILPRRSDSPQHQCAFHYKTWLAISGACMLLHTLCIGCLAYNFYGTPFSYCSSLAGFNFARLFTSLAQVLAVRAIRPGRDLNPVICLMDNELAQDAIEDVYAHVSPSSVTLEQDFLEDDIECVSLGVARYSKVRHEFTDFEVAVINFESKGGGARLSTANARSRAHVMAFLRSKPVEGNTRYTRNTTWLRILRVTPARSQFSITQINLCGVEFDVRVRVPYEGEARVCIQRTPAIVSTLEELQTYLQKTERYIDEHIAHKTRYHPRHVSADIEVAQVIQETDRSTYRGELRNNPKRASHASCIDTSSATENVNIRNAISAADAKRAPGNQSLCLNLNEIQPWNSYWNNVGEERSTSTRSTWSSTAPNGNHRYLSGSSYSDNLRFASVPAILSDFICDDHDDDNFFSIPFMHGKEDDGCSSGPLDKQKLEMMERQLNELSPVEYQGESHTINKEAGFVMSSCSSSVVSHSSEATSIDELPKEVECERIAECKGTVGDTHSREVTPAVEAFHQEEESKEEVQQLIRRLTKVQHNTAAILLTRALPNLDVMSRVRVCSTVMTYLRGTVSSRRVRSD